MSYPPVVIVDENDEVIGTAPLEEARQRKLAYRLAFVVARDSRGRFLLQKRAAGMRFFPSCWDTSAGGHVDRGQTYQTAALAELAEEIGVVAKVGDLKPIAHFKTTTPSLGGQHPPRFVKMFSLLLEDLPLQLGEEEVARVEWFTQQQLIELAEAHPDKIGEGLHHLCARVLSRLPQSDRVLSGAAL